MDLPVPNTPLAARNAGKVKYMCLYPTLLAARDSGKKVSVFTWSQNSLSP